MNSRLISPRVSQRISAVDSATPAANRANGSANFPKRAVVGAFVPAEIDIRVPVLVTNFQLLLRLSTAKQARQYPAR